MTSSLDKKLLELSLEEEDEPFDLPDLPEYSSSENNTMSLMGRLLNPECRKMANLISDMPRKWQIYDRVRGVALSSDIFQFIFKFEQDLEEILSRGVHTYNEWTMVIDRWVENPPPDYLRYLPVRVQIRNISVNNRTTKSIMTFGEFAGQVIEVAFDPMKA
ncbi:hypothetical protein V5N11_027551 [Cardamine amara subsp. amara]|uniref:DUF4283 domain-containing protein n=1 Tax=Cardamine amara subsp. amara TaxID=228776 RepID=A0ABD0ZVL0_CARAN